MAQARVIKLEALVQDDPPVIELGGITFQAHQTTWPRAARFETGNALQQYRIMVDLLRERTDDPDAITEEWMDAHLTMPVVNQLVAIMFRGETPDDLPTGTKRRRATS